MASFSHQDFTVVNAGKKGGYVGKPKTEADKRKEMQQAQRTGQVSTEMKMAAGTNSSVGGHGPMGTTAGAGARKLEEETETFKTQKAGLGLGKAIQAGRTAKKLTQKQLATSLNEKPQVINQYESGKAIPNGAVVQKLSRALGVRLPSATGKKKGGGAKKK